MLELHRQEEQEKKRLELINTASSAVDADNNIQNTGTDSKKGTGGAEESAGTLGLN